MKIGYACIFLGDEQSRQRTCTLKYMSEEKLLEIMTHNINALQRILMYNATHHIKMYRLSSDIIPFGSSSANTLDWRELFKDRLKDIGDFIKQHQLRVSMHPGQYTILNALNTEIIERSILDLKYHCDILDMMNLDASHKMILHVGGIYGDKQAAMKRFIDVYKMLPDNIKQRLVIENDDRYYTIEDVLYIASKIDIPVIFDNLHHEILPPVSTKNIREWLAFVQATWKKKDGTQKIHYSEQAYGKRKGAHATHLQIDAFLHFLTNIDHDIDIMLEVKDKNISACKMQYLLDKKDDNFYGEWKYYCYLFYLHSISHYAIYEAFFTERKDMDRYTFYKLSETFMDCALMHENYKSLFRFIKTRWYHQLSPRSQMQFERYLKDYDNEKTTALRCMIGLYRIALREQIQEGIDGLFILWNFA